MRVHTRSILHGTLSCLLTFGLVVSLGVAAPLSGSAPLDNDPDDEPETYQGIEDLDPGDSRTESDDGGNGFAVLEFGIRGGGSVFGWTDLDGDPREVELVVSDPTLAADDVRQADADDDDDPEVVWVGTQGSDVDGDGQVIREEAGSVAGMIDIDGDGNTEIIVQDTTRPLGEFHADAFGINRAEDDPREVLWVGILGENGRGRAASVLSFADVNDDGESEVVLQDNRTSGSPAFDQFIDIDGDGDGDIVIRIPEG